MKPSILKTGRRKIVAALAVASLMSGMCVTPAFADPGHDQGHRQGRDEHRGGHDRHDDRGRHDRGYPYAYAQPVYVPPTVYVAPQESPGISLFLPLNFRR
jgi:hypothetical protein